LKGEHSDCAAREDLESLDLSRQKRLTIPHWIGAGDGGIAGTIAGGLGQTRFFLRLLIELLSERTGGAGS